MAMAEQLEIAEKLRDDEIQYCKDIVDGKPARLHTDEILTGYKPPSTTAYLGGIFITLLVGLILFIAGSNATSSWGSYLITEEQIGLHACACAVYGVAALWFFHEYRDSQRAEEMCPGIKDQLHYEPTLGPTVLFGFLFCLLLAVVVLEYPQYLEDKEWLEHAGEIVAEYYSKKGR